METKKQFATLAIICILASTVTTCILFALFHGRFSAAGAGQHRTAGGTAQNEVAGGVSGGATNEPSAAGTADGDAKLTLTGLASDPAAPQAKKAPKPNAVPMTRMELTAKADLGSGKFTYHFTPENRSVDVGMQFFVRRDDLGNKNQFDQIDPKAADGSPLIISLYKGLDNTGTFTVPLTVGRYGVFRLLLFHSPDGKSLDFGNAVYDSAKDKKFGGTSLNLEIKRGTTRVVAPTLVVAKKAIVQPDGAGTYTVTIPATVRFPPDSKPAEGGWWVMAKGTDNLFTQVWVTLQSAQSGNDPDDPYKVIPVHLVIPKVTPGLKNAQFGLFRHGFGDALQWVYPGLDFEAGETWVKKAPADALPPRLRVRGTKWVRENGSSFDFFKENPAGKRAVSFVRGGNYGNAIVRTVTPQLNRPGYFALLKEIGLRYVRFNFNPDRYADEPLYQHAVDQVVQNIWTAGLYPLIAPQDLPEGNSRDEQAEKGLHVVQQMAEIYRGKPVWLEICNEPHAFGSWAEWKPVATRYVKAIRAIDPNAFVVVPFEGYGKDGRGAAKSPITDVDVDLYDGHAYVAPNEVATLFGPAVKAGLPVMVGEYGGGNGDYLNKINIALQSLSPGLLAAGPWAFTVHGEDNLPLVADGSRAELHLTPPGQAIAKDYAAWDAGKRIGP